MDKKKYRNFIAILMAGMGSLFICQMFLADYMGWDEFPWDVIIFLPLQFIWAFYVTPYLTKRVNK